MNDAPAFRWVNTIPAFSLIFSSAITGVHIIEMNGEIYRLKRSRKNAASQALSEPDDV